MNRIPMMGPGSAALVPQWVGWRWSTSLEPAQGAAQVGPAISPPGQVTGTSLVVGFGPEVLAGDWLNVAWNSLAGMAVPLTFSEPGWELVKAANPAGNNKWAVYRRQAAVAGAQNITVVSAAAITQCGAGWWTRSHGAPVMGVIQEGANGQTLDLVPGVAAPPGLAGLRMTVGSARVGSTVNRATVVSGATPLATFPVSPSASAALQHILTADRTSGGPVATALTWPPGGTRGGGGFQVFYPDQTPGVFQL